MGLRNASAYSKKSDRPFTRKSKLKSKSYIKVIPPSKIVKFYMGDTKGFEKGRFTFLLELKTRERIQIRDNAIEAVRQTIHKDLELFLPEAYFMRVVHYPHQILRENKMYSGASKGDRVNTGMSQSFGASIGRAAIVKSGATMFSVAFAEKKFIPTVRKAFLKAKTKLPCGTKIVLTRLKPKQD